MKFFYYFFLHFYYITKFGPETGSPGQSRCRTPRRWWPWVWVVPGRRSAFAAGDDDDEDGGPAHDHVPLVVVAVVVLLTRPDTSRNWVNSAGGRVRSFSLKKLTFLMVLGLLKTLFRPAYRRGPLCCVAGGVCSRRNGPTGCRVLAEETSCKFNKFSTKQLKCRI